MNCKQKIKNYIQENKYILKWAIGSLLLIFCLSFFVYVNNSAKNGIYPEQEFGTLEEFEKQLNPYINIYNIKEIKVDNSKYFNKTEKFGFGFQSTDNKNGPIVVRIYKGSPSEKAGLQVGDVIIYAEGTQVVKDSQLGKLIDSKNSVKIKVQRVDEILDILLDKGYFIGEEGFDVGSSKYIPTNKNITDDKIIDRINDGLNRLQNGLMEYSVEGISFFGAFMISLLWVLTILPVIILGILFYKLILRIPYKILIIIVNLFFVSITTSITIFLCSKSLFFDQMVRESIKTGGGFIDFSFLMYPVLVIFLSLFLIIGYTITLFIYKKHFR